MPTYLSPGVYIEEVPAGSRPIEGVGTAVAAFVGLASAGPTNAPTLVSNWSQFTQTFGEFVEGAYLAHAVYAYFQNGGGNCYVVRVGADDNGNGHANGSSASNGSVTSAPYGVPAALGPAPEAVLGDLKIQAREASPSGEITVEVQDAGGDAPNPDMFKIVVKVGGQQVEEFDRAQTGRGRQNVVTMVNTNSKLIRIEEPTGTVARPATGTAATLVAPAPPPAAEIVPATISADDYVGDVSKRTGFGGLEVIDEVTMVAVPDLMGAYQKGLIDLETVQSVQLGMIAHCELMGNRIAILDPPPNLNPQQIKDWRVNTAGYDSAFAALYWPWVKAFDPASKTNIFMPPSGHIAGIWGRNDDTRGVHKAPANEVIRGVVSLETAITKTEHDLLNPIGINCLRVVPRPGHPGLGRAYPRRPTRPGDTSTSVACSTTSRNRSSAERTGSCSSRTIPHCGRGSDAPSADSS